MDVNKTKIINASGAGNGLAAASDLAAGEVIIKIVNPYILVVEKASLDKVCSECLLQTEKLKRCARCKVAQYCSPACQKASWSSVHRLECSALARMPGVPPTPVRALMQILLTHSLGAAADPRWKDLKPNQEYLSKTDRYPGILLQARAACEYAKFFAPNALEMAVGILCRMSSNAFRATATGGDPVGLCFEPVIALANHSCSPNASIVFSGRKIMLRALDDIKQGDQIFISYIDGTQRREARQGELREAYFFDCKCWKCVRDETPYEFWLRSSRGHQPNTLDLFRGARSFKREDLATSTTDERLRSVMNIVRQSDFHPTEGLLRAARETSDSDTRLTYITQALETLRPLQDNGIFALPPYPTIVHELYLYYIDHQSFVVALSLLLFMQLNCYFYSYPQPSHPSNVERLYTIARLCGAMMLSPGQTALVDESSSPRLKDALLSIDWMSATHAILVLVSDLASLSHGKNARFTVEAAAMLGDIEEAQKTRADSAGTLSKQRVTGDEQVHSYTVDVFEGLRKLGDKAVMMEIINLGRV